MLKQLNGFKVFYICWLAFLVIELILIVFGLSFTPLLSCLWFDFLFLVLFFHLWSIFYKKREFKFFSSNLTIFECHSSIFHLAHSPSVFYRLS